LSNEIFKNLPVDVMVLKTNTLSYSAIELFAKNDIIYQRLSFPIVSKNTFDQFLVVAIPDPKQNNVIKVKNRYVFINQQKKWYFYEEKRAENITGET
jgi:hypothetical protein